MMSENMHFTLEGAYAVSIPKKRHSQENKLTESNIPTKSPRYTRKKRSSLSQSRRSNTQLTFAFKTGNMKLPVEKHHLFYGYASSSSRISNLEESQCFLSPSALDNRFPQSSVADNRNSYLVPNHELKSSSSCPNIFCISSKNSATSKSCDNLIHFTCISKIPESISKISDDTVYHNIKSNSGKRSFGIDSTSENINNHNVSRRSSTSTVRERNNSIDSTFSQISISEIKEAEEILDTGDEVVEGCLPNWKVSHSRSKSNELYMPSHTDSTKDDVFSLPNSFSDDIAPKRKSIFEGRQVVVPTECFFPRPQQGQSLTSFLSSNEFNISAELDRENAHFCISEALISAIEHMKCSRTMKVIEEEDDSDEEIRKLTQRIRIRRRERQREKVMKNIVLLSDGKTDTTTSQSASPPLSSLSSDFEVDSIGSEDEIEDIELSAHTESNLSSMKENGLSLSMASLYSDADIHKVPFMQKDCENKKFQESESNNLSAESVALSLLRRFSEKHLPKASDLQWLVSEQDAPQRLLPLPNSWPVSPDTVEEEYNLEKTRLRGNLEWAPPRPQIIFIIHPNLKRKDIMEKQKYRCAGCGMKIEKNYINRFRYCEYFGKYFCQCCHSNSLAYIPGRILFKWDFSKYYVSKFAWNLLDQMFYDPLFSILDINNNLYQKVRQLEVCRVNRLQLFYLKDFIRTCRKAETIQVALERQNPYIVNEPHTYSLNDLILVKNGELSKHLSQLTSFCLEHVKQCILCQAKGFICEVCGKDNDIIFPFQLGKVILCHSCGSCFHKRCFKNVECPKCLRIKERKKRHMENKSDDEL